MKFMSLLRKSKATDIGSSSELDDLLTKIVQLEKKNTEAKDELETARKGVQEAQAAALDGGPVDGVGVAVKASLEAKERSDGMESLLSEAKTRAISLIAAGSIAQRKRLEQVEVELAETRRAIDERTIKAVATFARERGLRVQWPTKDNQGAIFLPATTIENEEIEKIAAPVIVAMHRDPDDEKLEKLYAEKLRLNVLTRSQPDLGLEHLMAERRRK